MRAYFARTEEEPARLALEAHSGSVEAAAAWLLRGSDDSDDGATTATSVSDVEAEHLNRGEDEAKPAVAAAAEEEEWRIDPSDGKEYTMVDFLECYGGLDEWHAAAPPAAAAAGSASQSHAQRTVVREQGGAEQEEESMESYVSRGLGAMGVDEDLSDYFIGMMGAMAVSLVEEGRDEGFEEGKHCSHTVHHTSHITLHPNVHSHSTRTHAGAYSTRT